MCYRDIHQKKKPNCSFFKAKLIGAAPEVSEDEVGRSGACLLAGSWANLVRATAAACNNHDKTVCHVAATSSLYLF